MSQEDGEPSPDRIVGLPLDDAVEALARDGARDPEAVRRALAYVTDDEDVVTTDAVDEALAHLSKVVSTPETRTELAAIELSDAREAAEPVTDLDTVRVRLDAFESRLEAVEARVLELGAELQTLVGADVDADDDLYEVAAGVRDLTVAANSTQQTADELQVDIEEFERWLSNPAVRRDAFEEEVDALAESLDRIDGVVDALATEVDTAEGPGLPADGPGPAVTWFDATLRHGATELLFTDLRAELADVRVLNEQDGADDMVDDLDARLADRRERWRATGDRLADLARPAWRDRFDDRLSAFDATLDGLEPPIDWGAVQAALDEHRATVEGLTSR